MRFKGSILMVTLMIPWKEKNFNEKTESLLAAQRQNLVATCLVKADWLGFLKNVLIF